MDYYEESKVFLLQLLLVMMNNFKYIMSISYYPLEITYRGREEENVKTKLDICRYDSGIDDISDGSGGCYAWD